MRKTKCSEFLRTKWPRVATLYNNYFEMPTFFQSALNEKLANSHSDLVYQHGPIVFVDYIIANVHECQR